MRILSLRQFQLVAWCHTTVRLCQDWLFLMGKMLKESRIQKPILSLASLQLPCQMAQKKCVAFTVASVIFTGCQCPSFFHTRLPCRSDKQKDTASKAKMSIAPFVAASWNPSHHECIRWVRKKATRLNFNRKMLRMSEKPPKKKQHFRKTSWWVVLSSLKWTQETDIPPPEANSDPAIKGGGSLLKTV